VFVVDKLIKGGPTTEHEGEENFNMHLVHGTDNEAEMDVEFIKPQHSVLLMMTGPFELLSWVPYSFPFGIGQVLLSAFCQVASDNPIQLFMPVWCGTLQFIA
jgi:hypothetical protein